MAHPAVISWGDADTAKALRQRYLAEGAVRMRLHAL